MWSNSRVSSLYADPVTIAMQPLLGSAVFPPSSLSVVYDGWFKSNARGDFRLPGGITKRDGDLLIPCLFQLDISWSQKFPNSLVRLSTSMGRLISVSKIS